MIERHADIFARPDDHSTILDRADVVILEAGASCSAAAFSKVVWQFSKLACQLRYSVCGCAKRSETYIVAVYGGESSPPELLHDLRKVLIGRWMLVVAVLSVYRLRNLDGCSRTSLVNSGSLSCGKPAKPQNETQVSRNCLSNRVKSGWRSLTAA